MYGSKQPGEMAGPFKENSSIVPIVRAVAWSVAFACQGELGLRFMCSIITAALMYADIGARASVENV